MVGEIMQFHIDKGDPNTFVVGCLSTFDTKWFLLQSVSYLGKWDGLALYLNSDLVSLETEVSYLEKMNILLRFRNEKPPNVPETKKNTLFALLEYARETGKFVAIELHMSGDRDVIGSVHEIYKNAVQIRQVDEYGRYDGETLVSTEAISRVFLDDEELKCLKILSEHITR